MSRVNPWSVLSLSPDNHFTVIKRRKKEYGVFLPLSVTQVKIGENGTTVGKTRHEF